MIAVVAEVASRIKRSWRRSGATAVGVKRCSCLSEAGNFEESGDCGEKDKARQEVWGIERVKPIDGVVRLVYSGLSKGGDFVAATLQLLPLGHRKLRRRVS